MHLYQPSRWDPKSLCLRPQSCSAVQPLLAAQRWQQQRWQQQQQHGACAAALQLGLVALFFSNKKIDLSCEQPKPQTTNRKPQTTNHKPQTTKHKRF